MESTIIRYLHTLKTKRFSIENVRLYLEKRNVYVSEGGYPAFYESIQKLVEDGVIKPVKARGFYHMEPPLYAAYQYQPKEETVTPEILMKMKTYHPLMQMSSFIKKPSAFLKLEKRLDQLNYALYDLSEDTESCTVNQRSYLYFKDEKYLASQEGLSLLKEVGITFSHLRCYATYEPFMYTFSPSYVPSQNVIRYLVVENKDTHDTVKRIFFEKQEFGGYTFDLVIYGEGKKILRSFPYLNEILPSTSLKEGYYMGDLDPEGLAIASRLCQTYGLQLAMFGYEAMIRKNGHDPFPTRRTEQKNVKLDDYRWALNQFSSPLEERLTEELMERKGYLPEEILTPADWRRL